MQSRHVPSWLLAQLTRVSCLQNHRLSDDDLVQAMMCLCGQSSVLRQAFRKINRKQSDLQEVASADDLLFLMTLGNGAPTQPPRTASCGEIQTKGGDSVCLPRTSRCGGSGGAAVGKDPVAKERSEEKLQLDGSDRKRVRAIGGSNIVAEKCGR